MGAVSQPEATEPITAYVALGANLEHSALAVRHAMDAIDALPNTRVTRRSSLYLTAALSSDSGGKSDAKMPDYVNAVVALETTLVAPLLLEHLQQLENAAGRERPYRDAPRTLDLDLLLYGSARVDSPRLTVPHPRMTQRAFVLVPLSEVAPEMVSQAQLKAVADQLIERLT